MTTTIGFTQQDKEALDVLAGTRRPAARPKAAVRIEDLAPIMDLPVLQSKSVSGSPTEAEFNLLLEEFRELRVRIANVAKALELRLTPR
jgi:hypothetical protein